MDYPKLALWAGLVVGLALFWAAVAYLVVWALS